jgi:VanZ like family
VRRDPRRTPFAVSRVSLTFVTPLAFARRFGPAILMMALIYVASDMPGVELPQGGGVRLMARKAGHVLGYALLGLALLHALVPKGAAPLRAAVIAVGLAAAYGATDEFHQSFIPGRGPAATDVLIDAVGASLGVGLRLWRQARRGWAKVP